MKNTEGRLRKIANDKLEKRLLRPWQRSIALQDFQEHLDPKDCREGTGLKDFRGSGALRAWREQRGPGDFPVSKALKDSQEIPDLYTAGKRARGHTIPYSNTGCLRLVVVKSLSLA